MSAIDLGALCRACGLCCDGSLFGRGTLEPDEVERARKNHLVVVPNGGSFEQRCSALGDDGACRIYDERPRTCRRFVCRLHERARAEQGPIESYVAVVQRVRELIAQVEATDVPDPELTKLLYDDFERA